MRRCAIIQTGTEMYPSIKLIREMDVSWELGERDLWKTDVKDKEVLK